MDKDERHPVLVRTGERLRHARVKAKLNLEQLSTLTGISKAALSQIETGKRDPRLTTLCRIADAIRMPVSLLVQQQEEPALPDLPNEPSRNRGYDLGDFV